MLIRVRLAAGRPPGRAVEFDDSQIVDARSAGPDTVAVVLRGRRALLVRGVMDHYWEPGARTQPLYPEVKGCTNNDPR